MEMMDRLVRLYDLPDISPYLDKMREIGITIRHPRAYEKPMLLDWVESRFSRGWAGECDVSFSRIPVSCYIATKRKKIIGFSCYEATQKNVFGPIGVAEQYRGSSVGTTLLLAALYGLKEMGYAYAVVGGPTTAAGFYRRVVGAMDIDGSTPGIYIDRLIGSDS